ncbi:MAG TPA: SDR family oxidoreductase [Terriglobales bacterium]|nr:SDR family oxidoreductase [Terriglobales bacterium]
MSAARFFAPDLFAGTVALVTGGGTGIGRAIATALMQCGAEVVIASRKREHLEQGRTAIEAVTGRAPLTQTCDIREPDQVAELMAAIVGHHSRLDLLVNNAGGQFAQRAENYAVRGWNAVISTNLNGTWYMTQAAGKHMIANRSGIIVNVIANHHRGIPGCAHTSAARAAVANLTKSLAVEWGDYGIRINAVAPGPIAASGFTAKYDPAVVARAAALPIGRLGTVDEVAAAVLFLASPASAWTTGATLDVTGGQHLHGDTWVIDPDEP